MCLKHWRMVPKFAQDRIWETYRPGQEIRKDPTNDYLKAQQGAVILVLAKEMRLSLDAEGLRQAAKIAFPHLPDKSPDASVLEKKHNEKP